jgi:plastocyanin
MTRDAKSFGGVTRRGLLGVTASAGGVALAGCFESGSDEETQGPNEIVVGPNNNYVYDPESLTVNVGDTVTWTWASNDHNIVVESQPDGGEWSGTAGGDTETYDEGHTYEYTFETPGTYAYYCTPHRGLGMEAEIVVEE